MLGLRSWATDPMGKCDTPSSSKLLFRLLMVSPCRSELDRRNSMSSTTRSELDRARSAPPTVGLSGSDRLFALVVTSGGGRVMNGGNAMVDPRLEPKPPPSCPIVELKLMFDFRRLLCRSNVFWAENGLGRRMYLRREKKIKMKQCGFEIDDGRTRIRLSLVGLLWTGMKLRDRRRMRAMGRDYFSCVHQSAVEIFQIVGDV